MENNSSADPQVDKSQEKKKTPLEESSAQKVEYKYFGEKKSTGCCSAITNWFCQLTTLLYVSHTFSAWGDRMWEFATGMFLIALNPDSLRLTAIYTFTSGGAVLLLGAFVGAWVDKYPRLPVVRVAIVAQNLGVAVSAVAVCLTLVFQDQIVVTWDGWLLTVCEIVIIFFSVAANVCSVARTIAVERDWIVIICKDTSTLTNMSALLRRIDLTTKLVAPIITGQIITYGSMVIGAIFIAVWNFTTMFAEYGILSKIYHSVPELANKGNKALDDSNEERKPILSGHSRRKYMDGQHSIALGITHSVSAVYVEKDPKTAEAKAPESCLGRTGIMLFSPFMTLYRGWSTYMRQSIMVAGLSLAAIYMTVLTFDNITNGYAIEQGLSESMIGILQGVGAVLGISGTLFFPVLRKKIGLEYTGTVGGVLQLSCLSLCVISIFAPGSSFDPNFFSRSLPPCPPEDSDVTMPLSMESIRSMTLVSMESEFYSMADGNSTSFPDCIPQEPNTSYMSISLLMAGIVGARFGLWIVDLTVTQLLIEKPMEHERGVVNGVQNSLNQSMDLIRSLLVILLPWPQTFGFLILISFGFVFLGFLLFSTYSIKTKYRQRKGYIELDIEDRVENDG